MVEENDANVQQKFNTSTCSVCNKDATDKYISCSEYHIQIHYRCTFLPPYQLYYFVEKKSKYTYINCTPTGSVDLSSDGVDVLKNDIKEHLAEIETINNLLREENHLRGENIQNKNNLKVEKTNNASNVKDLKSKIKKMQTELSEANRKLTENIKEINRLKHQINKDTDINGTPNIIDVISMSTLISGRTMVMANVLLMNLLILRNLLPWSFKISTRKLLTLI